MRAGWIGLVVVCASCATSTQGASGARTVPVQLVRQEPFRAIERSAPSAASEVLKVVAAWEQTPAPMRASSQDLQAEVDLAMEWAQTVARAEVTWRATQEADAARGEVERGIARTEHALAVLNETNSGTSATGATSATSATGDEAKRDRARGMIAVATMLGASSATLDRATRALARSEFAAAQHDDATAAAFADRAVTEALAVLARANAVSATPGAAAAATTAESAPWVVEFRGLFTRAGEFDAVMSTRIEPVVRILKALPGVRVTLDVSSGTRGPRGVAQDRAWGEKLRGWLVGQGIDAARVTLAARPAVPLRDDVLLVRVTPASMGDRRDQ